MNRYGSRKFVLAAFICASATVLLACGMLDADTWLKACSGALALYAAGNVAQKATAK